jgi:hypothetical protein
MTQNIKTRWNHFGASIISACEAGHDMSIPSFLFLGIKSFIFNKTYQFNRTSCRNRTSCCNTAHDTYTREGMPIEKKKPLKKKPLKKKPLKKVKTKIN